MNVAVEVAAEASEESILELIHHTDRVSEVPNSLRLGTPVTLGAARAVSASSSQQVRLPETPAADGLLEMLGTAQGAGNICALLTPTIKGKLREMAAGQVLEVRVDDPGAREDIAAWCRLAGHDLLATVDEMPRYTRYFLRKKRT